MINQVILSGIVLSNPFFEEGVHGRRMSFHMSVSCGAGFGDMWVACRMNGKKTAVHENFVGGDFVTVIGRPRGIGKYGLNGKVPLNLEITDVMSLSWPQ